MGIEKRYSLCIECCKFDEKIFLLMLLIFPGGVLQGIYIMRHLYHACYIQYVENVFGWSKYICLQCMFATGVKMVDGNGGFCLKAVGYGLAPILSTDCFSPQTAGLHFLNFSRLPEMTREDFCASPWNLPRKLSLGSAFMSEMILTASMIQQANGSSFF